VEGVDMADDELNEGRIRDAMESMKNMSTDELEAEYADILRGFDESAADARAGIEELKRRGLNVDKEEKLLKTVLSQRAALEARMRAVKGRDGVN
jgi:predicted nuclease with TOPRIM domain